MQIIEDGYGGNDDPIKTKASKKVNVSINPETMAQLSKMKVKLSGDLGFTPSYSEVIQYLIKQQYPEQTDNVS